MKSVEEILKELIGKYIEGQPTKVTLNNYGKTIVNEARLALDECYYDTDALTVAYLKGKADGKDEVAGKVDVGSESWWEGDKLMYRIYEGIKPITMSEGEIKRKVHELTGRYVDIVRQCDIEVIHSAQLEKMKGDEIKSDCPVHADGHHFIACDDLPATCHCGKQEGEAGR